MEDRTIGNMKLSQAFLSVAQRQLNTLYFKDFLVIWKLNQRARIYSIINGVAYITEGQDARITRYKGYV